MRQVVSLTIVFYQRFISAMFPPRCRYYPSCSQYTLEAVERYGACRGVWLGIKRISRCHPFAESGYDPVPAEFALFRVSALAGKSVSCSKSVLAGAPADRQSVVSLVTKQPVAGNSEYVCKPANANDPHKSSFCQKRRATSVTSTSNFYKNDGKRV